MMNMERKLLDLISEKEAQAMVKYTIQLEERGLWEDSLDLLCALESEGAFLINGAPQIHDPEARRPPSESEAMGETITACLAIDSDALEAICANVIRYVREGEVPTRWTDAETLGKARQRLQELKDIKSYARLDEEAQEAREKRRNTPPPPQHIDASNYERELILRLRTNPAVRLAFAKAIGARISAEPLKATGVACPRCDQPSIWFYIDVDRMNTARCNHQNSCGYWGSLYDLARATN